MDAKKQLLITLAGFVLTAFIQVGGVFWWASGLTTEVKGIKDDLTILKGKTEGAVRLEQRVTAIEQWIQEFKPIQSDFIRSVERLNQATMTIARMEDRLDDHINAANVAFGVPMPKKKHQPH